MHLGIFPDRTEVQSWKVNDRVLMKSSVDFAIPTPLIHCMARRGSFAFEHISALKIVGRTDFPDYDELDAMMASAPRKLYDKQTHFRKKVLKSNVLKITTDFGRGTQIASVIFDHFRSTGFYDGIRDLLDAIQYSVVQRRHSGFCSALGASNSINK